MPSPQSNVVGHGTLFKFSVDTFSADQHLRRSESARRRPDARRICDSA